MAWAYRLASYRSTLPAPGMSYSCLPDCKGLTIVLRIRPESTIPICLDLGTNTQRYLDDPFYMGIRQKRVGDEEMAEFMDEFMHEMSTAFPKLMVQFEVSLSKRPLVYSKPNISAGFLHRQRIQVPRTLPPQIPRLQRRHSRHRRRRAQRVPERSQARVGRVRPPAHRPPHPLLRSRLRRRRRRLPADELLHPARHDQRAGAAQNLARGFPGLVYDTRGRLAEHKKCMSLYLFTTDGMGCAN